MKGDVGHIEQEESNLFDYFSATLRPFHRGGSSVRPHRQQGMKKATHRSLFEK